jgi:hypothetical protein
VASVKVVVLPAVDIATRLDFVLLRVKAVRASEIIQVGVLLCEAVQLEGYHAEEFSVNEYGHTKPIFRGKVT